jgi:hypothetical protein
MQWLLSRGSAKKFYKLGFRKDFHKHFAAYVTFDLHRSQISLSLARL